MAWHSKYRLDLDLFSSLGRCLCALLGDVQRWKVTEELIKVSCGWRCYILMPATTIRHQCQIITKNIKSVLLLILLVPLSQFTLGETEKNNYWGKDELEFKTEKKSTTHTRPCLPLWLWIWGTSGPDGGKL